MLTQPPTVYGSEAEFRRFLERLPAAAYACDATGLIVYFNAHAAELWGREPKLGAPEDRFCGSFRLFAPDGSPIRHDECWMALALQENQDYHGHEIVIERPDGTRVTALAHANPLHDEQGQLIGAVNVLVDITERKRAEEDRAHLAAIVTSSHDAVIGKTLDGVITSWNQAAERLYGYPAEEIVGQSIARLVPPDRAAELPAILARIRRGERVEPFETARMTKDGRRIDVWLAVSPIETPDGRIIGASAIARDIAERKQMEAENRRLYEQVQEALRLRNRVLASVSHDLKNPLMGISGSAQILERQLRRGKPPAPDQLAAGLRRIHELAQAMAGELNELLDVAALEAGQALELRCQPVDLVALAEQAAADAQRATQQHVILVVAEEAELIGQWDRFRLERVLRNLLSNATKYSPEGGAITISIGRDDRAPDGGAVLSVQDDGLGIPASDLPTIFEPFHRGANVTGHIIGTGLGLPGVRRIVEQHGGTISIESRERAGTMVTVRLPLRALVERTAVAHP
jgi:PAS domain S-box-containing protein